MKNGIEQLALTETKKEKDGYGAYRGVCGEHWSTSGFPNPATRRSPSYSAPSFFPLSLDSTNFVCHTHPSPISFSNPQH